MRDMELTVDRLARALYETDEGVNGYPPTYTAISWQEINDRSKYMRPRQYDRAERIMKLLGEDKS